MWTLIATTLVVLTVNPPQNGFADREVMKFDTYRECARERIRLSGEMKGFTSYSCKEEPK